MSHVTCTINVSNIDIHYLEEGNADYWQGSDQEEISQLSVAAIW